MNDLAKHYRAIQCEIDAAIARVFAAGVFENGPEVAAFEEEFARFCGAKQAIAVGSGTGALQVALLACRIGPGDEVISVPNSDISSTSAISRCGASVVWADVDRNTFNLDPKRIEEKITSRTKAIMAVHLYGNPADMDHIMTIAQRHRLMVIEDAALAAGATYRGRRVGTFGQVGCFSFAPSKVLGAFGDGGIIVTNDDETATRARQFSGYGEERMESRRFADVAIHSRFHYVVEGLHSHLDTLQAAILRVKLTRLDEWIGRRRDLAHQYDRLLSDLPVVTPKEQAGAEHVYRVYVIRVRDRDRVREHMARRGVATGIHYIPPLHLQPVYRHLGCREGDFPVAEELAGDLLCLPIFPELSRDQLETVVDALQSALI